MKVVAPSKVDEIRLDCPQHPRQNGLSAFNFRIELSRQTTRFHSARNPEHESNGTDWIDRDQTLRLIVIVLNVRTCGFKVRTENDLTHDKLVWQTPFRKAFTTKGDASIPKHPFNLPRR